MNEKIHFNETPYLTVKNGPKSDKYMYSERLGVDSVAFIIQTDDNYFLLTEERKPPMDARISEHISGIRYNEQDEAFIVTAFGGSNDKVSVLEYKEMSEDKKIQLFVSIVADEGVEEAGYKVNNSDIHFVGKEFVSTQSNQLCYLFLVDARNAKIVDREPETEMEAQAELVVCTKQDIINSIDWKSKAILFRLGE